MSNTSNKELIYIEAVGEMLRNYHQDLLFIKAFQERNDDYFENTRAGFNKFLANYRISRNIIKGKKEDVLTLLDETGDYTDSIVDNLAKNISDNKLSKKYKNSKGDEKHTLPISLSSKILFLKYPDKVIPLDVFSKAGLGFNDTRVDYAEYYKRAIQYKKTSSWKDAERVLKHVLHFVENIEADSNIKTRNIEIIRTNRFLDKVLWAAGMHNISLIESPCGDYRGDCHSDFHDKNKSKLLVFYYRVYCL